MDTCAVCAKPLRQAKFGPRRKTCSNACRMVKYRRSHRPTYSYADDWPTLAKVLGLPPEPPPAWRPAPSQQPTMPPAPLRAVAGTTAPVRASRD